MAAETLASRAVGMPAWPVPEWWWPVPPLGSRWLWGLLSVLVCCWRGQKAPSARFCPLLLEPRRWWCLQAGTCVLPPLPLLVWGPRSAEGSARRWDPRWGFHLSTGCPVHRRVCADFCLNRPPAPALLTCLCPLLVVYFWGRLPPGLWWQSYHFLVIVLLIQLS